MTHPWHQGPQVLLNVCLMYNIWLVLYALYYQDPCQKSDGFFLTTGFLANFLKIQLYSFSLFYLTNGQKKSTENNLQGGRNQIFAEDTI